MNFSQLVLILRHKYFIQKIFKTIFINCFQDENLIMEVTSVVHSETYLSVDIMNSFNPIISSKTVKITKLFE